MIAEELGNRLAALGAGARANSNAGKAVREAGVPRSSEFLRIEGLPRREWTDEEAEVLALQLTAALRQPNGEQTLRPLQAVALLEAFNTKGLFAPIRVGGGKSLIALLIPTVLKLKRPMLILPASRVKATERMVIELSRHWKIQSNIRIVSYNSISRTTGAQLLEKYKPDGLIFDEVHKIKNGEAAVTTRVLRNWKNTSVPTFVLSGTITKRSLRDYSHVAEMSLPNGCPIPLKYSELEQWCNALDEKCSPVQRSKPGALLDFLSPEDRAEFEAGIITPMQAGRRGFAHRLVQTPGVVKSRGKGVDCSLRLKSVTLPIPGNEYADWAYAKLRQEWSLPDDHELNDAMATWRAARQLALGFYYRWDPWPPEWWDGPRKAWSKVCRYILKNNRRALDSEKQVKDLLHEDPSAYQDLHAAQLLQHWEHVEPHFKPNKVAVWFDDTVLKWCVDWAAHNRGIIWVEHIAFGEMLAQFSGLPFYHEKGLDRRTGAFIEDEDGKRSIIASADANSDGHNMQYAFNNNLVVGMYPDGLKNEQQLGRTHREGQPQDEVYADVLVNCLEHGEAIYQAIRDAEYQQDSLQEQFKLCYADKDFISLGDLVARNGPRWTK